MPLVSGVCRTASAPMLSHGGSRLNASKPEANPKTRYPPTTTTHFFLNIYNTAFRRGLFLCFSLQGGKWRSDADCGNLAKIGKTSLALSQGRREGDTRIACRSLLLLLLSFCHFGNSLQKGSRSNRLSNHCRLRGLWWRQVFS